MHLGPSATASRPTDPEPDRFPTGSLPRRTAFGAAPRVAALLVPAFMGMTLLAGCTGSSGAPPGGSDDRAPVPGPSAVQTAEASGPGRPLVLDGRDAATLALQASRAVWQSSPVVVTAPADDAGAREQARELAIARGVPLLLVPAGAGPADPKAEPEGPGAISSDGLIAVTAEIERLGATHVLHLGEGAPTMPGVDVVADPQDLPDFRGAAPVPSLTVLTARGAAPGGGAADARASILAAGGTAVRLSGRDPRATAADVRSLAGVDPTSMVAIGRRFGDPGRFAQRVEAAVTGVQLPGGGQTVFGGKRYVALYGHPRTGALGALGEQGPTESVDRVRALAELYAPYTAEAVIPAFEIIATVATGSAGDDGDFSNEWDVEVLRPLVRAAADAGIYVVLDLQSGREDFLSQARLYEELLREPHVGLAMDPEWRLGPGEKPLEQIGTVSAAELNEAIDWLAALTDRYDLPQKMVLLHQFTTDMISDREELHLHHDTVDVIVQMDGDGTLGQKLQTWNALRAGAPKGLRFGWKNFYDEDEPTPSPATTFQVRPTPWWVSYQ